MNEEEILKIIKELMESVRYKTIISNEERKEWKREYDALQGLLDLYSKQQKIIDKAVNFIENGIEYFDKTIPDDISFIRVKYIYKDDIDELLKILKGE